ncbi:MAG: hypothetical protein HYT93_01665 [Parcubacteria group bacterium]|nr:hypothetical protein [Parcubacteria group bacterium]
MPKVEEFVAAGMFVAALALLVIGAIATDATFPVVIESQSSQECLYVVDQTTGTKHDCGFEKGKRHHHQRVK